MTTPDPITVLRDLLAFWRSFDGPTTFDEIQHPALDAAKALTGKPGGALPVDVTHTRATTPRWQ